MRIMNNKGFSYLRLILIVFVVWLLMPKIVDLSTYVYNLPLQSEQQLVDKINSGIDQFYKTNRYYPNSLDDSADNLAMTTNPFFSKVINPAVKNMWHKNGNKYKSPNNRNYLYDPKKGKFSLVP